MKLCLLGVENARNICKNKVVKANSNKITRFLQLRKIVLLFATVEALDNIKIMPCVEGDGSDCQPEASSIARSRRLRAMVVVEG